MPLMCFPMPNQTYGIHMGGVHIQNDGGSISTITCDVSGPPTVAIISHVL